MISPDQTGELVEATYSWARSLETAFGAPEPRGLGGRESVARQVAAAVARARQRIVLLSPADGPADRGFGLGPLTGVLADSARGGRDVRLLLGGKRPWRAERSAEWTALAGLQEAGVSLRAVPGPVQPMLLADAVVLLGSARETPAGQAEVLQVAERSAARVAHHLADMLWETAEPL
ncbi:hypothetical protein [Actinacidiphila yeochonensis]|uniref:hypothetical protein n=1 Tax=Actinacidiphila yeochonensis TaxID=89050 RepID=UPI0005624EC4|nr:hypothetical protein [Actinacidiphila yeochonensis]